MTECERIIKEGILPSSFFEPETICDFYVDEKRKKIWAVCIDLLIKFDRVCKKNDIKYFVAFGSLLGIVRHNGFIPWDDDIDVCMLREDYEKLLRLPVDEFEDPYFLQIPCFDHEYCYSFAKLRNSNTSAVILPFRYGHFNQGISLDIFPLDNFDETNAEKNYEKIYSLIEEMSASMRRNNLYPTESDKIKVLKYPERNIKDIYNDLNTLATSNNGILSEKVYLAVCTICHYKKYIFKREDVSETVLMDFYGYKVPVPKGYETFLKTNYGDYMKLPPVEKRGQWHGSALFNPDVAYPNTLLQLRQKDMQIV